MQFYSGPFSIIMEYNYTPGHKDSITTIFLIIWKQILIGVSIQYYSFIGQDPLLFNSAKIWHLTLCTRGCFGADKPAT